MSYFRDSRWCVLFLVLFCSLLVTAQTRGEDKPAGAKEQQDKFLRLRRDNRKRPQALETAVVRYVGAKDSPEHKGVAVDLIGAVHVGDRSYYKQLNELFQTYDVLLYELVAPEGTRIPKGGRSEPSANPLSGLQQGLKSMLGLEFQLEQVDYTKANFVHADMSPEEFSKSMKDRGESVLQIMFRMMGQAIAQQSKNPGGASDIKLLFALFADDRETQLKRIMAEQFDDLGGALAAFEGPDGSTLITERNKKALEVLRRELKKGHKKIGIFYGAGHLADMAKRLENDFAMKQSKRHWLAAWDLTGKGSR